MAGTYSLAPVRNLQWRWQRFDSRQNQASGIRPKFRHDHLR